MEMLKYFIAAIVIALVLFVLAKIILQFLIRRPTDYYTKEEKRQEDMMMEPIREANKKGN